MNVAEIAREGYEKMRAVLKDNPTWEDSDEQSWCIEVVEFFIANPDAPVSGKHDQDSGPDKVPFGQLPIQTRVRYTLLHVAVHAALQAGDQGGSDCPDKDCSHWDGHSGCDAETCIHSETVMEVLSEVGVIESVKLRVIAAIRRLCALCRSKATEQDQGGEAGSEGSQAGPGTFLQAAFKVGQRVRVKNWEKGDGTVIAMLIALDDRCFAYNVKLDKVTPDSEGHLGPFYENELEPKGRFRS
jgi:hypothetical protein